MESTQSRANERALGDRSASALHAIHEITTVPAVDFAEQTRQLLRLGCQLLGLPIGAVSHVANGILETRYVVCPGDELPEGHRLDLCSTFCNEVIETRAPFAVHDALSSRWKDHPGHTEVGITAYIGAPITIHGNVWGTLCFFDVVARDEPFTEDSFGLLDIFAKRIQVGLEHELVQHRFRSAVEATVAKTGDGFFTSMVRHLADVLQADWAFVAECLDPEDKRARTLAVWRDGALSDNFEYDTAGTPCEGMLDDGIRVYSEGIAQLFPDDHVLEEDGLESFVGAPVFGLTGKPLGHLVALRRSRMDLGVHDRWLIEIFAARAGAELERLDAEAHQRELERQVVEAEKLRSLGVLAGGIAHDFNNLLVGILGNADLALDEAESSTELYAMLTSIGRSARRAEALTKQMLVYAGQAPVTVQPLNLNDIVQEMPDLLGSAVSKGAEIETLLGPALSLIEADITQVRQVVMNLVINASDAIGSGRGRITIATGTETLGDDERRGLTHCATPDPGRFAYVEVTDTGRGMDDDTVRRMFEPFFSTKFTGRGLGLSTVMGIVQRHGGAIRVDSRKGDGTTIRISFPVTENAATADKAPVTLHPVVELEGQVLVVDDDPEVRNVTGHALKRCGLDVHSAGDGDEALEVLKGIEPDLAIVDLTMPGMSGRQLARHIHDQRPDMPIVLMSGFNEPEADGEMAASGIIDFIQKPFRRHVLLEKVRAALQADPR